MCLLCGTVWVFIHNLSWLQLILEKISFPYLYRQCSIYLQLLLSVGKTTKLRSFLTSEQRSGKKWSRVGEWGRRKTSVQSVGNCTTRCRKDTCSSQTAGYYYYYYFIIIITIIILQMRRMQFLMIFLYVAHESSTTVRYDIVLVPHRKVSDELCYGLSVLFTVCFICVLCAHMSYCFCYWPLGCSVAMLINKSSIE